jgi:hypothetical protein
MKTTKPIAKALAPPRLRLKLVNVGDIRRELARVYRDSKSGHIPIVDGSRLANILQILSHIIQGSDLEARIEALEANRGNA